MSEAGFCFDFSSRPPKTPFGSNPMSSPNMQNVSFIRKCAARPAGTSGRIRNRLATSANRLAVPVKLVWTSKRSRPQTTKSGGFSRASR